MIVLQAKRLNCNRKKWIYIGGGDQKFVLTRGQQQLPFLTNWCSLGAATNCLLHEWRVIFSIYEALIYVSSQDKLCIWFLPITNKCPFQRGCTMKQGNWVLFLYLGSGLTTLDNDGETWLLPLGTTGRSESTLFRET